jgi:hypothetical protein
MLLSTKRRTAEQRDRISITPRLNFTIAR